MHASHIKMWKDCEKRAEEFGVKIVVTGSTITLLDQKDNLLLIGHGAEHVYYFLCGYEHFVRYRESNIYEKRVKELEEAASLVDQAMGSCHDYPHTTSERDGLVKAVNHIRKVLWL